MTSSDRFPVPVRSAVKSNLTDWCFQKLSKRALNALTVQASTTKNQNSSVYPVTRQEAADGDEPMAEQRSHNLQQSNDDKANTTCLHIFIET